MSFKKTTIYYGDFVPSKNLALVTPKPKEGKKPSENIVCFINYRDEVSGKTSPLRLQTPAVETPFQLRVITNPNTVNSKNTQPKKECKLTVTFKKRNENPNLQKLYEKELETDDFMLRSAAENAEKWFGIPGLTAAEIKKLKMFKTSIYEPRKKNPDGSETVYEPCMQFDIPLDENDEPILKVTDAEGRQYSWTDIKPWTPMVLAVEKNAVWKVQNRIGITPKVTHVMLLNTPQLSDQSDDQVFNSNAEDVSNALAAIAKKRGLEEETAPPPPAKKIKLEESSQGDGGDTEEEDDNDSNYGNYGNPGEIFE